MIRFASLAILVAPSVPVVNGFLPPLHTGSRQQVSHPSFGALYLTAEQEHAKEVFDIVDEDGSGSISAVELGQMLSMLDIQASDSDAEALFKYLDRDGSGEIGFDEFAPWYEDAAEAANMDTVAVRNVLLERRTVRFFDQTPVSDDVLRRAIECAIRAPNYSESEPWRFISVGPETARKIAQLRVDEMMDSGNYEGAGAKLKRWVGIPGWCVVTSKLSDDTVTEREDFASTACAVQNFMLSLWSEGVGSRLTCGPVTQTKEYAKLVGVDTKKEKVVGCIWYGFASGGLASVEKGARKKSVDDILSSVP